MYRTGIIRFFFAKNKTYTRIDYNFIFQNAVTSLIGASIGSCTDKLCGRSKGVRLSRVALED